MISPRFKGGDRVRTRALGAAGHTRLPRYLSDRSGVIVSVRGAFALADERAAGAPNARVETVYGVRFEASEIFDAPDRHCVVADLWESYLEADK